MDINITGVDLKQFVKDVYDLSVPRGMGILHFQPGGLSDEEAEQIVNTFKDDTQLALSMDYVKGRGCKMTVWRRGEGLLISNSWFDHTDNELRELLSRHNIAHYALRGEHGMSCECANCKDNPNL